MILQSNIRKGVALSFVSLILLGILPVISNSRPMEISALNFALFLSAWQLIFAFPVLLAEIRWGSKGIFEARLPENRKKKTIWIILATGCLFGLSTFLYVFSMEKAGTVSASIAIQAYPLFSILWETFFLNRKKSRLELLFTFLLVTGLYYLGTGGTWQIEGISFWFFFAFSVPFIWSVAHVIIKEVIDRTPVTPAQVTFFRVLVSTFLILVLAASKSGFHQILNLSVNPAFQVYAAAMGLVYYLELVNWFYAVRYVDVSVASSITTPWPLVTALLAVLFLHERVETFQMMALIIVLVSVYGILWAGKRRRAQVLC